MHGNAMSFFRRGAAILLVALCLSIGVTGCSSQTEEQATPQNQNSDSAAASSTDTDTASSADSAASSANSAAADASNYGNRILVLVNGHEMYAELADNPSAAALAELLATGGPLTIDMHDSGNMEKVGALGQSLPTTATW